MDGLIRPLTGIRGYAALWVVFYHVRSGFDQLLPDHEWARSIISAGFLGVDLFALLSGFIISLTYAERLSRFSVKTALPFLWLRLARVYPLLLAVLALFVGAGVWAQGLGSLATTLADPSFWMQALMLNGWGLESRWVYNVPSWTVSSEWLCYLVFPLLAPLLVRVRAGWQALALAGATLGATILAMRALGYPYFDAHLDFGWVRIVGGFLAGCWLYRAMNARSLHSWPWGWIGLASLILALYACAQSRHSVAVVCFAVLVYAMAQNSQPLRWLFGNRVSLFLGEISYSVYMVHWFVLAVCMPIFGAELGRLPPGGQLAVVLGTILLFATLTHFSIERPARARMRKWLGAPAVPAER